MSPTAIPEESEGDGTVIADDMDGDAQKYDEELSPPPPWHGEMPLTPVTIVSPPSPSDSSRSRDHEEQPYANGLGLSDPP